MSIPVSYPYNASRANTSSSKLALPERSPRPLTQVWGTATPASTAARLFATARPKSLWPWNESSVGFRRRFRCPKNQAIPGGVITPTVSQTTARWAPAAVHASYKSTTKSRSARNVSSVTKDTSTPWATAYSVSRTAASFTWSRVIASLSLMCKSDPAANNATSPTSHVVPAHSSARLCKPRHALKITRGGVYRRGDRSHRGAPSDQVRPRVRGGLSREGTDSRGPALSRLRGGRLHPDAHRAGPEEGMVVRSERC